MRKALHVAAFAALAFVPMAFAGQPVTQPLNPPPLPWQTCKAVGNGTICDGTNVESVGPYDTGISCGSFDIYDTSTDEYFVHKEYNADGNLVRRYFHDHYAFGEFSNSLTRTVVPYTQTDTRTDVFVIPGDASAFTETATWEIQFHGAGAGAPVFRHVGRTVFSPDGSVVFEAGQLGFDRLFAGDASVVSDLCAALSATG